MAAIMHEVMSSLTKNFGDMAISVWFASVMVTATVRGYTVSIKTWLLVNKTLLCTRHGQDRARFWGISRWEATHPLIPHVGRREGRYKRQASEARTRQIRTSSMMASFVSAPKGWCFRVLREIPKSKMLSW